MKILITGSTGFLGTHLSESLKRENDIYLTANHNDVNNEIHKMDLLNINEIKGTIEKVKPDVIFHLGALVNLSRNFEIGKKCLEINLVGTLNLLESLRGSCPKRLIFASTEEVYGDGKIPYKENQICFPPSYYAVTKLASENLIEIYSKELGFSGLVLRMGTMYGPKDSHARFIPQIIKKAIKNEDILLNSGMKKRDYVYVEDAVRALILSKDCRLKTGHIILNIGGGTTYKLIDLVNIILKLTNSKSKVLVGKLPERINEADKWLLDIEKAKKILKWVPKVSIEEGIKKSVDYFKKN